MFGSSQLDVELFLAPNIHIDMRHFLSESHCAAHLELYSDKIRELLNNP